MSESAQGQQVGLLKIYTKDVSFESPASPKVFQKAFQPSIDLQVSVASQDLGEDTHEVTVTLNVTAKDKQNTDEVLFIVEIEHSGLFSIKGFGEDQMKHIINVFCPTTIFPYARATVDQLLNAGGFPSLQLAPVNFEGLFRQAKG